MALGDALAGLFGRRVPPVVEWLAPSLQAMVLGLTPEELYRTQPHLRTVLSFVSRNVAHLGLKVYQRTSDTDRVRLRDDPLALLLSQPNPGMTGFELLETLASDLGLYDVAYWYLAEDSGSRSGWVLQPIPPSWVVDSSGRSYFSAEKYTVRSPNGRSVEIAAADMIVFHGWNPGRPMVGSSPVDALKHVLAEQVQAWSYREQVWQRGGRVGTYMTRPAGAVWSDAARDRFMEAWRSRWTGMDGSQAGGTPILEDGMELHRLGLSAREEEWAEVSKVALATVAGVFHVNPVMVGMLDNANFANTREFRKMLYTDTLGPTLARIEDRINGFLAPRVSKVAGAYVEFNIEEKLQGDFLEQGALLSTAAGAPWMTRNEVRALRNLPEIAGADDLVVPLNVLVGGQASPRDSGSQNTGAAAGRTLDKAAGMVLVKASQNAGFERNAEKVLLRFFRRQRSGVLSALGVKAPDVEWWDGERWDRELADDVRAVSMLVSSESGRAEAERLGFGSDGYDVARTEAYMKAAAEGRAAPINEATRRQIQAILDGDGPDGVDSPAHVFDVAEESRAAAIAGVLVAASVAFAVQEVGKQNGAATKTWRVTSNNPRPSHAAMDGETVGLDEAFSNGAMWPCDTAVLDVDEVAGCSCALDINYGR